MMLNLAVADAPELLLLDLAGEQRLERPAVDRARKPEPGRNFPAPLRGFVPALGVIIADRIIAGDIAGLRSEEHTSELQSLMRISYAVFCLKKKKTQTNNNNLTKNNKDTSKHKYNK